MMNSTQGDPTTGFIILFLIYGLPLIVSWSICRDKHRNVLKGIFLTLFFGWIATAGLWLALKTRDPKTGLLI